MMNLGDFTFFLTGLKVQLQDRNPLWVGKVLEVSKLVGVIVSLSMLKGVKNAKELISDALNGDSTTIE
jgi:hypothetical protein